MCGLDYVKKFQHAKGGGGEVLTFKNLDSLLGLEPVLVPLKSLGRFTPMLPATRNARLPMADSCVRQITSSEDDDDRRWQ